MLLKPKTSRAKNRRSLGESDIECVFIGYVKESKGVLSQLRALFLLTVARLRKLNSVTSGSKVTLSKSKLMGIGISNDAVVSAARSIGCAVLQ
ncbi:hypothetical protein Tco_0447653, partial [Tanacetum coccineum]